jgi:hypothetical protein
MLTKALFSLLAIAGLFAIQTEDKALSGAEVKAMLQNMGYETKDLNTEAGKEKVEFMVNKGGYDVWMASEVSPSKRFVWLTSFLGDASKITGFDSRAPKILQKNFNIQPSQFYTTDKGNFYMAIAVDNRNVTPAVMKWRIEKLAEDVASSADLWKP